MWISNILMSRAPKPDNFWRKRRVFKMTAHYFGRRRNCYSIAIRNCHRALVYSTKARQIKKADIKELWEQRISAGCSELGSSYQVLARGLARCCIALDRRTLANLSIWEPRTFKSLIQIASTKLKQDSVKGLDVSTTVPSVGVVTRGML
uniref:Large ribosomal subunit protein bL20m n=1 Tax=Alona affinis TaxID=381656 RepID=A0A9N6ZEQ7_9CRUS|nr:EOG090X0H9C [Alona affinis]